MKYMSSSYDQGWKLRLFQNSPRFASNLDFNILKLSFHLIVETMINVLPNSDIILEYLYTYFLFRILI